MRVKYSLPKCDRCPSKACLLGPSSDGPAFCPMKTSPGVYHDVRDACARPETRNMFRGVARTWKETNLSKNRIEEVMTYARVMGFKRLGLAFCIGLSDQARVVAAIFEKNGFEVVSVCCMSGGFCSDDVGLSRDDKMHPDGRQPQCSPVGQALLMRAAATDLNIMLGLCVGDDALFIKHSAAPVTVLAVKDRMFDHNPLASIPEYKQSMGL